MSNDVRILANIANFDVMQNEHISHIGKFHELDENHSTVCQFQNNEPKTTYEQGFEEGYAQAENFAQRNTLLINTLKRSLLDMKAEIEAGHRQVLSALLQTALPALTKKTLTEETADFIMSLSSCALGGQVQLKVHPKFEPALKQIIQTIDTDDNGQITFTITTCKNISGSTVQAFWQGGGATLDIEKAVRKLLMRIEQD